MTSSHTQSADSVLVVYCVAWFRLGVRKAFQPSRCAAKLIYLGSDSEFIRLSVYDLSLKIVSMDPENE